MDQVNPRVLLIGPASVHLQNYLERLKGISQNICIVTSSVGVIETDKPLHVVDFSFRNPLNLISTPTRLRKIFRSFKPDIVHVHQLNSVTFYTILALYRFNTPILATAWGSDVLVNPNRSWLWRKILAFNLRRATAFTSDAQFMADRMREFCPERDLDITIVNFGVSDVILDVPKESIIYSNRLHHPLYRIDRVIRAFEKFHRTPDGRDWKLVIAATGSKTQNLKKLVGELAISDAVTFVGWLGMDENTMWYARSKVWVSIPESDATAISLLEAMHHGCLPVVIDLPATHEWITHGENGIIVENVEAPFLNAISSFDFSDVLELNRTIIQKEATHEVCQKRFSELYNRLFTK
ncbi:MAG TPA: glycosyltransferase family 4 protein [Cryomorphaceae bacterium]|nr:glycosyltransferase family 4 protein [Cryomorphaceae bacterium]